MLELIQTNFMQQIYTIVGLLASGLTIYLFVSKKMTTKNFSREIKELESISKKLSGTIPDVDKREILFHLNKLKTTLEIMENRLSGNPKKKCRELISITDKHLSKVTTAPSLPVYTHPSVITNCLI